MITIRKPLEHEDIKIAELIMVIFEQMELSDLKTLGKNKMISLISRAMRDPEYRYSFNRAIVADDDGEIAGVAFSYANEEEEIIDKAMEKILKEENISNTNQFPDSEVFGDELYLDSIVVQENQRGKGIGSSLILELTKEAKKQNKKNLGLNVDEENPQARKLYERLGFKEVAKKKIGKHNYSHLHLPID